MKKIILSSLLLLCSQLFALEQENIKPTVSSKIEILKKDLLNKSFSEKQKMETIKLQFEEMFDFELMAKIVIGRDWNNITEDQRKRFTAVFKKFLEISYSSKLSLYNGQEIKVEDFEKTNDTKGNIKIFLQTSNGPFELLYKMYSPANKNNWKVYDMVISGVSMIQVHKNDFGAFLQRQNIEELIKKVDSKNNE